jgi:hypothetical protein
MSRVRSPNYPQISLPEAIRRVEQIRTREGRNAASREALAKLLGFGGLNGASMGVISAISKYGLIEDAGDKELKVSDLADSILFPHEPSERAASLSRAASTPALFAEINQKWPDRSPTDENLRSYLIRRGFAQNALDNAIACYRETMGLVTSPAAGYNGPGASGTGKAGSPDDVKVGDYVQWEQGGVLQLTEPQRVTWISDDRGWLRIEGSPTGIPMAEVRIADRPKDDPPKDLFEEMMDQFMGPIGSPLSQRLKVMMTGSHLRVSADLINAREVQKLIKILEANQALLGEEAEETHPPKSLEAISSNQD